MVTEMKETPPDHIQMRDSGSMVGECRAEVATLDCNWTKVKGGNAGVGGAESER